ncbi:MAG: DEAD/DEAH box helicase [Candidatus Wallbacteria bacterium]|nr:DEAD/DEAH box helicase [Candidatus Wallbacteria bacterium]
MLATAMDLWLKVLATLFGAPDGRGARATERGEPLWFRGLADFQRAGVAFAMRAMERFGGALVCDSPGLGKTRVALAVAGEHGARAVSTVFVIPKGIEPMWQEEAARAGVTFRCVTHDALGRFRRAVEARGAGLVVVDEAHAFRNGRTRSYARLAELCAGRRVLLVTATPINNRIQDLYHQLRLFAGDGSFASEGVADLRVALASGVGLGSVLAAVVTRHTREDLATQPDTGSSRGPLLTYPARRHVTQRVSVAGPDCAGFGAVVSALEKLAPAAPLLVFLLAKRLASSIAAFLRTLDRLQASRRLDREAGGASRARLLRRLVESDVDDEGGVQGLLRFDEAAQGTPSALETWLGELAARAAPLRKVTDGKAASLAARLHGELAGRKTLIFTEYRETAEMLFRTLQRQARSGPAQPEPAEARPPKSLRIGLLHGSGAMTASGRCSREAALLGFTAPDGGDGQSIDLLVATDILSEGLNLQAAECVVSYDLPWNPVRLVQRAGRIDRIGSPHETVRVLELAPDRALDRLLRLSLRLQTKRARIERAATARVASTAAGGAAGFLEEEHRHWSELAPRAMARSRLLPDGLLCGSTLPPGARPALLAVYAAIREPGWVPALVWLLIPGRGGCHPIPPHVAARALLKAARRSALSAQWRPGTETSAGWRRTADRQAARLLGRAAAAGASGAACRPLLRRVLSLFAKAQRACRTDLARLRRLERLEQHLSAAAPAGVDLLIRERAGPRPSLAQVDALVELLEPLVGPNSKPGPSCAGKLRLLGACIIVDPAPSRAARRPP